MTLIERSALRVVRDLDLEGFQSALVGGLAVSARAIPRTTLDVDFAVSVDTDAEAEGLVHRLRQRGYQLSAVLEQRVAGRLATARLRLGGERRGAVDLLFASSGIEREVVAAADDLQVLPGIWLPVAKRGHLVALKILSHDENRRPQDRQDILALLVRSTEVDLELAREALGLIARCGFHRDKNLAAELEEFTRIAAGLRSRGASP